MRRELKNLFAFLTIFPLRMDENCLSDSARYIFLFPLVGAIIGLLAGLSGWLLYFILPSLIVGAIVFGILLLLTGLHHTDGLLDFGDGVMAQGTSERKIEIMHDQLTGAGGLSLGIMTFLITSLAMSQLNQGAFIQSIIVAELAAKLSMVIGCWAGKSVHTGMNSPFLDVMHGKRGKAILIASLVISFGIAIPLLQLAGAAVILVAVITSFTMVIISHRHFKGITGDVLGATNELTRMVTVIALVAVA
jgi:adenosylcobinamide-GDP ribazoletransferase